MENKLGNIAIYDFCQTLVDFETADEFINYIRSIEKKPRMMIIEFFRLVLKKTKVLSVVERIKRRSHPNYSYNKRIILSEIKGLKKKQIDKYASLYYENVIKKHFISKTLNQLIEEKNEGYLIVVVSAAYEPYLQLFAAEYNIDYLITNSFEYDLNGRYKAKLIDDCIGENKVRFFLNEFPEFDKSDYDNSVAYGDSKSDIPILSIVEKGYVVSPKKSKNWAKENGLEDFIW